MESYPSQPKVWLEREFSDRRAKNPAYSLRAFARFLDIPSGRVSQILSSKRALTPELGKKIAERLGYDPDETEKFLKAVEQARKTKGAPGALSALSSLSLSKRAEYKQISQDQFQSIAEPIHYDILSLIETDDFESDCRWISKRLEKSVVEVRAALGRLQRLGLVRIDGETIQLAQSPGLSVDNKVKSTAIRQAHKLVLDEAKVSIDDVDALLRDVSTMTMAVDPARLVEAKAMITEFRRRLTEFMESGPKREVYRLNVQLVPVTKISDTRT